MQPQNRNQAETFVKEMPVRPDADPYKYTMKMSDAAALKKYHRELSLCSICMIASKREISRILDRYKSIGNSFGGLNMAKDKMDICKKEYWKCSCDLEKRMQNLEKYSNSSREV